MNEITQRIINEMHSVVAQRTPEEAYFLLDQIIAEAQDLQTECSKMLVAFADNADDDE